MKAVITGGAGRQCLATTYDFIELDDVEKILLIDTNEEALQIRKTKVNSPKVETMVLDITDTNKLANVIKDYDVVLNGSTHLLNMAVMDACVEAKTNYTDFGGLFHCTKLQLPRNEEFKKAGITGIVGSGTAPGMDNVFAKYAVDRLDTVEDICILDVIANPISGYSFTPPYALTTIIDEFTMNNFEYINGEMKELPPFSGHMACEFPEPYGKMDLYNMIHSETLTLSMNYKEKGLKNAAFKLALPPLFAERLRFLVSNGMGSTEKINVKGVEVAPKDFILEMLESKPSLNVKGTVSQDAKLLRVIVKGTKDRKNVTYEVETDMQLHPWGLSNGHFSVGYPAAITTRMLGSGVIKEKGFFSGESVIPTDLYFKELARRGIVVTVKITEELG